jgi:hypothetical protein
MTATSFVLSFNSKMCLRCWGKGEPVPSEQDRLKNPPSEGKTPDLSKIEAVARKLQKMQQAQRDSSEAENLGEGCYAPVAPLAVQVNNVIAQRDELCHLCGEILATLSMPANTALFFRDNPEADKRFRESVAGWKRQYAKVSGDPAKMPPSIRPTVAELDAILNSEEKHDITINPDGSVTAAKILQQEQP